MQGGQQSKTKPPPKRVLVPPIFKPRDTDDLSRWADSAYDQKFVRSPAQVIQYPPCSIQQHVHMRRSFRTSLRRFFLRGCH